MSERVIGLMPVHSGSINPLGKLASLVFCKDGGGALGKIICPGGGCQLLACAFSLPTRVGTAFLATGCGGKLFIL